mmetsp:Transcript_6921/g.12240  ORF Transcript_6921/g.12240 Transcript_6921/m.12240 type:complete len:323 (-) Transcript_6921:34-1002(-)
MYSSDRAEPTDFRDGDGFDIVGGRCSLDTCREHDFLPFKCEFCSRQYCQKHAEPACHECEKVPKSRGVLAAICPLCRSTVKWDDKDSTEEAAMQAHQKTCQAKASEQKDICPAENCKTKLTAMNSLTCEKCKVRVCLTHRFEDAHACLRGKNQWLSRLGGTSQVLAEKPAAAQNWGSGVAASTGYTTPASVSQTAKAAAAAAADRRAGREAPEPAALTEAAAPASAQRLRELLAGLGASGPELETCIRTLRRLLENVSANPSNPKYRVVRRDNKAIHEKILHVSGAEELMKAIGFEDKGETLELPDVVTKKRIDAIMQLIFC